MKHPNRSESGQILVIIAFALVGLVGITGLAIDGSAAYADRRQAQNAADSASLAAALSYVRGSDWNAVALQRAASNGYDNNQETILSKPIIHLQAVYTLAMMNISR